MIASVSERINQYAFEQRLLNNSFNNLVLNNKEKQKNIHEALTKQYGSNVLADLIINQYAS